MSRSAQAAQMLDNPVVLHSIPGRLRVHLAGWSGEGRRGIELRLRRVPGIRIAEANPYTRNVLVTFDPAATGPAALLPHFRAAQSDSDSDAAPDDDVALPHMLDEGEGQQGRARIAVRGLDRDPGLARRVVKRLKEFPGVRALANPLTGRVLVEYDKHLIGVQELLLEISQLELPALPGEDRPVHPLDPGPLMQSAARTVGATLGLVAVAVRRMISGGELPARSKGFATAAGIVGVLQGFPGIRNGLRRLMGRNPADLAFNLLGIFTLTFASSPLGLIATGTEALVLLSEVAARRAAWRRYEERLGGAAAAEPGAVIRLEAGERLPLGAQVIEGTGTATGRDGLPRPVKPGAHLSGGARLSGGPFVLQLEEDRPFLPEPRPAPLAPGVYDRYVQWIGPVSLAYALLTAAFTRSPGRAFAALLLVNPRTAVIGMEAANLMAASRVLRGGVTIVGTRPHRVVRRPDVVLLDTPRVLSDGFELTSVVPLTDDMDADDVLALAAGVAAANGSPWGGAMARASRFPVPADQGTFDGDTATAMLVDARYTLGPPHEAQDLSPAERLKYRGEHLLVLRDDEGTPIGLCSLRPRLAEGAAELVRVCRRAGVELAVMPGGDLSAARMVARRADVTLLEGASDALLVIRSRQSRGAFVAFVSDSAHAAEEFAACDLAIGLSSGRAFPARADLLAPDMAAVASIVEAGGRRDATVRDAVGLSLVANAGGAAWGLQGAPGIEQASLGVYLTALTALADGWARIRGGHRPGASLAHLVDPNPERWGRRSIDAAFRAFKTTERGLTTAQAATRRYRAPRAAARHELLSALRDQIRLPITTVLLGGAGLSLVLGEALDATIIAATIGLNLAVGVWQERQVDRSADALKRLSTTRARLLRDGRLTMVPASEVVPGDILVLAPGDRVCADARLFSASGLEVDEASLTGESLSVRKSATDGTDASRVVLDGSDVLVGSGRAVVVAVGRLTRMGTTAAALTGDEAEQSPLGARLSQVFRLALPLAVAGGAVTLAAGAWRRQPLRSGLSISVTTALTVLPEGLPLLAGTGQAGVARRLTRRKALVRRLAGVESLGRVDVACTDKTGTLTEGRPAVRLLADMDREAMLPEDAVGPGSPLREILLTAALASPHPDAADARAHPTDIAVAQAAEKTGLGREAREPRSAEAPFDPARYFHACVVGMRLSVKGAPEALLPRCSRQRLGQAEEPLDETQREVWLARARSLADRGLRVLFVAQGPPDVRPEDPQGLLALGFVGISDPLRPSVKQAVQRCHEAGVHVLMLTGDHPATARAIAGEAGLLHRERDEVLTAAELVELPNAELDQKVARAAVVARATPLDKLRVIESLRRLGHTVAMTGDGVNDAPALRLADVGVAMGRSGTEVARQAADLVLEDDDFATLVEALVEGRGFWQNMRRGISLLVGGNLGELGLIVGASLIGAGSPLSSRQILIVNLITDALPALAVVLQQPAHRNLAGLAREGVSALDAALRKDVLRRGTATGASALGAYLLSRRSGNLAEAGSVAFASIVATQLAQTLDAGRIEGTLSLTVAGAVAASAGVLGATILVPPVRRLLGLAVPGPAGWLLVGTAAAASVVLSRCLATGDWNAASVSPGDGARIT